MQFVDKANFKCVKEATKNWLRKRRGLGEAEYRIDKECAKNFKKFAKCGILAGASEQAYPSSVNPSSVNPSSTFCVSIYPSSVNEVVVESSVCQSL